MSEGPVAVPTLGSVSTAVGNLTDKTAHRMPGKRALLAALAVNLLVSAVLMPVTANPFDFALITGTANSWLSWHLPLFLYWKFGADYAVLNVAAACGARVLTIAGLSVPAAAHVAFKLMLVVANLLAGLALWKLATRFRPLWARPIVVLWLLSPVAIWVAADHGQIEPVAAAATFWGLWFVAKRRWAAAGIVAGLGAGFEYVPLAVLVAVAVLVASRRATFTAGLRFAIGLCLALAVSFAPLVTGGVASQSLAQGLVGNATARGAAIDLKPGSIWFLGGLQFRNSPLESHWLLLLGLVASISVLIGFLGARRGSETAPFAATGMTLVAATVLDPATLPQFGVLALAGLCLMALEAPLPLGLIAGPPLLTLIAFLFASPIYVYFMDVDPRIFTQARHLLPQVPVYPTTYAVLATLAMGLEILSIGVWVRATMQSRRAENPRSSPMTKGWLVATVWAQVAVLAIAAVWSGQPQIWSHVVAKTPPTLFDTPYLTSRRADIATNVHGTVVSGIFDPVLLAAARVADPAPKGAVEFVARDFRRQTVAGGSVLPGGQQFVIQVPIPQPGLGLKVGQVDIEILARNPHWASSLSVGGLARIDGRNIFPTTKRIVVGKWAKLVYQVSLPSHLVGGSRSQPMSFELLTSDTVLNGDLARRPWLLAWYSAGSVSVDTAHHQRWVPFVISTFGFGQIIVSRTEISRGQLSVAALPVLTTQVIDEALVWDNATTSFARPQTVWQWVIGLIYLVIMTIGMIIVVRALIHAVESIGKRDYRHGRSSG